LERARRVRRFLDRSHRRRRRARSAPRRVRGARDQRARARLPAYYYYQVQHLPRIHDISTDTQNPPAFVAVLLARQGAENKTDYSPQTAEQQKEGYPDIAPARLEVPPPAAFERALAAARAMRWD